MNKTEKQTSFLQTEDEPAKNYISELFKWGSIVLVVWLLYCFAYYLVPTWVTNCLPKMFRENGQFQVGTFGDYFGALNTLFAGLAFAGIIVTIRQQSADLRATKREMRNQTEQFAQQNEQAKLAQIKEEVHQRIGWIKQLERDIEIIKIENGTSVVHKGAAALSEIDRILHNLTKALFPDNEYTTLSPNLTAITNDYLCYASSFQYTTSWVNSICTLLEDIHIYFQSACNEFAKQNRDTKELKEAEARYMRAVLNSFHHSHIAFIYAHHDTLFNYPFIEELRKRNFINTYLLLPDSLDRNKRVALSDLFLSFNEAEPDKSIFLVLNRWREHKGWPPCEMVTCSNSPHTYPGYLCPIEEIKKNITGIEQIKNNEAYKNIFTIDTGNSVTLPLYCYYISKDIHDINFSSFSSV